MSCRRQTAGRQEETNRQKKGVASDDEKLWMEVEQRKREGLSLGCCCCCCYRRRYFTPESRKGLLRTCELPGESDEDDENLPGCGEGAGGGGGWGGWWIENAKAWG